MSIKIKSVIFYAGIIVLIVSGSIYGINEYADYHRYLLTLALLLICISPGRFVLTSNTIIKNKKHFITQFYLLFVVAIVLSFLSNFETTIIFTIIGLLFMWYATNYQIPLLHMHGISVYETEVTVILLVLLLFQFLSLMNEGLSFYRYQGLYSNSNFTGGECATICAIGISLLLQNVLGKKTKNQRVLLISVFSVMLSVIIGFCTNSRTAVVTIIIMLLAMLLIILHGVKQKAFNKRLAFILLFLALLGVVLYSNDVFLSSVSEIIEKFYMRTGNELAGRQDRWEIVFDRLKFFGNGESTAFGTHNTYLSMLDQYGYFAFAFWILFNLAGLIGGFKLILNKQEIDMKYMPFFCFTCFICLSVLEQMMLKNIMLLCLYACPIIYITNN